MMEDFKIRLVLVAVVITVFATSFAALPPLGDVNCQTDNCHSVAVCENVSCSFGKLMTDPESPCGCCQICINYYAENENCDIYSNKLECGPGLYCDNSKSNIYKCVKMSTPCFQDQEKYDERKLNGSLGMYETRPNCDANGDYAAKKCQPGSSCYCVDKNNKRIFGESSPNNATASETTMNCECSRAYQIALDDSFSGTVQFPHCLPNGNYDLLQCVNKACFCINPVNKSLNSDIQPITAITELPCYIEGVHTTDYYRPCELEKSKFKDLTNYYFRQNITVLGLNEPKCSPDGYFQPILETAAKLFCADPYGKKIENFEIDKESPNGASMNCRCARTRYWLSNQNTAKPLCCGNGNYRPIQCRGGVCFCVDGDGNQNGVEVSMSKLTELDCYSEEEYPYC